MTIAHITGKKPVARDIWFMYFCGTISHPGMADHFGNTFAKCHDFIFNLHKDKLSCDKTKKCDLHHHHHRVYCIKNNINHFSNTH